MFAAVAGLELRDALAASPILGPPSRAAVILGTVSFDFLQEDSLRHPSDIFHRFTYAIAEADGRRKKLISVLHEPQCFQAVSNMHSFFGTRHLLKRIERLEGELNALRASEDRQAVVTYYEARIEALYDAICQRINLSKPVINPGRLDVRDR